MVENSDMKSFKRGDKVIYNGSKAVFLATGAKNSKLAFIHANDSRVLLPENIAKKYRICKRYIGKPFWWVGVAHIEHDPEG